MTTRSQGAERDGQCQVGGRRLSYPVLSCPILSCRVLPYGISPPANRSERKASNKSIGRYRSVSASVSVSWAAGTAKRRTTVGTAQHTQHSTHSSRRLDSEGQRGKRHSRPSSSLARSLALTGIAVDSSCSIPVPVPVPYLLDGLELRRIWIRIRHGRAGQGSRTFDICTALPYPALPCTARYNHQSSIINHTSSTVGSGK